MNTILIRSISHEILIHELKDLNDDDLPLPLLIEEEWLNVIM